MGYALKRANNHTQQSALLVVSKSYSSSTFILFAALLVATHGAAKSVSVDDDDARTQYSPVGWDRDFALDKTKVFDGTLHTYGCNLIACGSTLTSIFSGTANSTDVFFTFVFNGWFNPSPDISARVRIFRIQGHRLKFDMSGQQPLALF